MDKDLLQFVIEYARQGCTDCTEEQKNKFINSMKRYADELIMSSACPKNNKHKKIHKSKTFIYNKNEIII